LIHIKLTDQVDQYVEITHRINLLTQQHRILGVPLTTNQPPQQSPLTRNAFTSIEAAPLSTMKNQHGREKAKNKPWKRK